MLSFFRRIVNSKAGVVVTFIVLGVIALAFAAGDVTGLASSGGGIGGGDVAKVGKADITIADLRSRVQNELDAAREQQPTIDIAQFVAQGGIDTTLDQMILKAALEQFALSQGMALSKRLTDGELASIPALQGPNGKFDPAIYQRLLAQRGVTDAQIRADIVRNKFAQALVAPTAGAGQLPAQLALPYASLLLERRAGAIGYIPATAVKTGAAPTDVEVKVFYDRNLQRYALPERRAVRYALVTPASLALAPTDAEIAAAYQADRARYAASEKRSIAQVVVADQAGAQALAAKVRSGTPIVQAARAIGLEALTAPVVDKADYAASASTALADAVFTAPRGGVVGPLKGPIGWTVARVEGIEQIPARTLAQVRGDIAATLAKAKTAQALADTQAKIDDALSNKATFDEVVADRKLTAKTTPLLLANGADPANPMAKPDPARAALAAAGYQMQDGDPPQIIAGGPDGSFAVVALNHIAPAAPRPLAQVREAVLRDIAADRARRAARQVAAGVLAKVNAGTPLAQALAQTGLALPAARPVAAARADLARDPRGAPPPLALMFSMKQGTARLLEAQQGGWYIVRLDRTVSGDARGNPAILQATRADLGRVVGREYVEQFANAVRTTVGVKTDAAAIAKVRKDLLGQSGTGN